MVALILSSCQSTTQESSDPIGRPETTAEDRVVPTRGGTPSAPLHFSEIAATSGLTHRHTSGTDEQRFIVESISGGVALLDVDGDGRLDLFFVDGTRAEGAPPEGGHRLYLNEAGPDGSLAFRDVTERSGITHNGWGMGCAVGDIDNDGDPDLYITYWGADHLWRNDSEGDRIQFTDITESAGLGQTGWGTSAAFADVDGDGLLDLYVANYLEFDLNAPPADGNWCHFKEVESYCGPEGIPAQADHLYRNLGDGRFADVSASSGIGAWSYPGLGVFFFDMEWDGDLDLYVANDSEPNLLFRNDTQDGSLRFTEVGTRLGVAYNEGGLAQAGMGLDGGDVDNDGDLDILVTNFSDDVNTLYANDGAGWFTDATYAAGMGGVVRPFLGWSTIFSDFDHDGWLDLFVANGHVYPALERFPAGLAYAQRNLLYLNNEGRFSEIGRPAGMHRARSSRGAAAGDIDNDGDTDIVVANLNDTPSLWRNDTGSLGDWIGLDLTGVRSNRDAIGTRVRLFAGESVQTRQLQRGRGFESQSDPRIRFGLGEAGVDSILIDWPSGHRQVLKRPRTRRYLQVTEGAAALAGPAVPAPTAAGALSSGSTPADIEAGGPSARTTAAVPAELGDDPAALRRRAGQLYKQGRYEESRVCLERAIELDDDDVRSRINLAMVHYAGRGDFAEAIDILEAALQIDPQRHEAHHLLGKIRLQSSDIDGAVAAFAQATRLAPGSGEYQGMLGLALQRQGDYAAAETAFRAAARLAPWDPRPHLNLGQLYERTGLRDSTFAARAFATFDRLSPAQRRVEHYKRKLDEYPDHAAAAYLLGRAYEDQNRRQLAEARYRESLKLDPDYAPALHGLGRLLLARGQVKEALATFETARRRDPDLPGIDNDLGQAYHQQRRYDMAISSYQRALRRSPDPTAAPILYANLAMAQAMAGQLEASDSSFRRSLEIDATQIDTRDAYAQVLVALGKPDAAAAQWQEILRQHPAHATARQRLQQLKQLKQR